MMIQSHTPIDSQRIIAIPQNGTYQLVQPSDILYCQSEGNYTLVYLFTGTKLVANKAIKVLEDLLPASIFIRVHHAHLVNINGIKKYIKGDGGKILLSNNEILDVSRRKKKLLLDHFTIL